VLHHAVTDEATRLERLAELAVRVAANVQPGQLLVIRALVEHAPLVREVARAGYRAGARRVDVMYHDRHLTRAMVELGPEEALDQTPPSYMAFLKALDSEHGAFIQITGEPEPNLLSNLDGRRIGRAIPREYVAEWSRMVGDRTVNWAIIPAVTAGWAQKVFGKPDVEALWQAVEKAVRLDRADPIAAWRAHVARLHGIIDTLNARHLEALRYKGPGTDLTIGLLPSSRWEGADTVTNFGVSHIANIPTEEIYTSPDSRLAEGKVRSTRPLQLKGTVVEGLEMDFRDGRIVEVRARTGADVVRAEVSIDANAARLGEVSLVDGSSAVGQLGITFYDTLFDENATCHLAYGGGFTYCVEDEADRAAGLNISGVHTDFMVGGPEVQIEGKEPGGAWIPIIRDNEFRVG
jgi:aminopeptidase